MSEKILLKDTLFNPLKVRKIALEIKTVYPDFQALGFEKEVCEKFPELELKARIYHMRDMLSKYLPKEYESAVAILLRSLPKELDSTKSDDDFGDFIYAPYSEFVALYGCEEEYLRFSLEALRELTKRFSVEFSIRDFINTYPQQTLEMLSSCAVSENYHERRLASEGLRPKLPWAKKLTLDHREPLIHLDQLFYDKTRYVTRSVANHLNDISKIDAPLVIETLKRWKVSGKQDPKEMDYITNHALRTLIKQGDEDALLLLGYVKEPHIRVHNFILHTEHVRIGDALVFELTLEAKKDTKLIIDYIVHFRTKAGTFSPKVHKLKKIELKKDRSVTLQKKHLFKANMSTRKLHVGEHKVELQINGMIVKESLFTLNRAEDTL